MPLILFIGGAALLGGGFMAGFSASDGLNKLIIGAAVLLIGYFVLKAKGVIS